MPRGASTVPLPTHLVNGDEIVDITQQYPMFVMPIDKVLQLDRIPTHEEAFDKLVTWDPTMGNAMFVSHTWISFEHPDNADNVKLRTLQGLLKLLVAGKLKVPPNVFKALLAGVKEISAKKMAKVKFIWMDFYSVPQADPEKQMLAIRSIFSYVQASAQFLVLAGPWTHENGDPRDDFAWASRGWCRLESLANRLSKANTPFLLARSASTVENHGGAGVNQVMLGTWFNGMVVGEGSFSVDSDRAALGPIIKAMLAGRMTRALQDGDVHFYRLMHSLSAKVLNGTGASFKEQTTLDEWMTAMQMTSPTEGEKSGWTPLRYACLTGRVELCEELIARGAKVNVALKKPCEFSGFLATQNLLHTTCWSLDSPDIARLLIKSGVDPWEPSPSQQTGDTPAVCAAIGKQFKTLEMLCSEVSPEVLTRSAPSGKTLTMMMGYGGPKLIEFLLSDKYRTLVLSKIGGKGNYDHGFGASWCSTAAANHVDTLRFLLDAEIDPEAANPNGLKGIFKVFRGIGNMLLIHSKAPGPSLFSFISFTTGTSLHSACYHGRLPCVELLIERDCDVNHQQLHSVRMTPLMCAAVGGHGAVADALLAAGADPNLKDKGRKTAASWAKAYGHVELAQKLVACMTPTGKGAKRKSAYVVPLTG